MSNDRYQEMLTMHNNGATFQQIGNKYGVSRQRVHQILAGNDALYGIDNVYHAIKTHGGWIARNELIQLGGNTGGHLTQILRQLETEGKIEMRTSNTRYNLLEYRAAK